MENSLKNLESLDPWIRKKVESFCLKILACFHGRISSICLYGSTAVGDHIQKYSDINLMILIDNLEIDDLKGCLKLIKWGRKRKISAPLLLTQEHIINSTDTFPIEFLEMKEKHVNLYGTDPFADLAIDPKNLRLQCEQQIKGKLIRLRQSYLEVGLKRGHILGLLTTSLKSILPILRNSLRLVQPDSQPPKTNEEIIIKAGLEFGIEKEPFMEILQIKKGLKKPDIHAIERIFKEYLSNLTELSKRIDHLKV